MIRAIRRRIGLVVRDEAGRADDRGITLVELMVAMMIFAFLLTMTAGFMVSASRATVTNRAVDASTRTASNAINEISRVVRAATNNPVSGQTLPDSAFVTADDNQLTIYAYVNLQGSTEKPVKITFGLSGTNLVETTYTATPSGTFYLFGSTPSSTRILASPVVLPTAGGPNLFTYVKSNGVAISTVNTHVPDVTLIAAVTLSVQIGTANTLSQSTFLTSTVGLPNLGVARTS